MMKLIILAVAVAFIPGSARAEDGKSLEQAQKVSDEMLSKSPLTAQFDAAALEGSAITVVLRSRKDGRILDQLSGTMKIETVDAHRRKCDDPDDRSSCHDAGRFVGYRFALKGHESGAYELALGFLNDRLDDIRLESTGSDDIVEHYWLDFKDHALLPIELRALLAMRSGLPMNHSTGLRDDSSPWTRWIDREPVDVILLIK